MHILDLENKDGWFESDSTFNELYPAPIQALSNLHWTPLEIAIKASDFLSEKKGEKILDIGSGVGKFCLAGAHYTPKALYFGIEQRESLITHAENAKELLGLGNVSFIHGNFTRLDFRNFDHFYFYNSFYENLAHVDKIDNDISFSQERFDLYTAHLFNKLAVLPEGTKLVTYHAHREQIPNTYNLVRQEFDNKLEYWTKYA